MRIWTRTGYLAVTAALAAAGTAVALVLLRRAPGAVAAGIATAWVLQAPSFWRLAGAISRNEAAVRDWLGGIGLRLGGLALLAAVGGGPAWPRRDLALAYVATLLAYLLLEAVWLFRLQPEPAPAAGRERATSGSDAGRRGRPRAARRDGPAEGGEDPRDETSADTERAPDAGAPTTTEPPAR